MLEIAKKDDCKTIQCYIAVKTLRKNFSIAKIFPSKFLGIFANIFQRKIIPVYSSFSCLWVEPYIDNVVQQINSVHSTDGRGGGEDV